MHKSDIVYKYVIERTTDRYNHETRRYEPVTDIVVTRSTDNREVCLECLNTFTQSRRWRYKAECAICHTLTHHRCARRHATKHYSGGESVG